ncbi:MgtC/SapB family protein [Phreatobacter aquaticus]|uniref:MgtC/SapB family protein n=1 Tax=Phreatobacter aquaticus TaxID=2570229 RepID=A0A4D7QMY4_9HYPH|nr:DUF4010 domain-containing protein [Phreatobacter aquaticus]QCK87323.1 MgtC/SapB family protein [Phreatobacter aquaticus]
MSDIELFQRFALAAAIGALVGVERHWQERDEAAGQRTAGLRTFTLVGMLGGAAGLLELALATGGGNHGLVIAGLFLGLTAAMTVFKLREAVAEQNFSVTSLVAAMLTFAMGALAILGDMRIAAAGGVTLTAVLASREALHGLMRKVTWPELRSAIVLLVMTVIVLPLVPAQPIGPFGGISPSRIWLLAILLAGISYLGYLAARVFGATHGALIAGAIGGLLSSTATTVTNARQSISETATPASATLLAAATLAAGAVAHVRTAGLAVLLVPALAPTVIPALAAAALVMALAALLVGRTTSQGGSRTKDVNPFDLSQILQTALLLGACGFAARAASAWFGEKGLFIASALSALADVDATTVAVGSMVPSGLATATAATAILIGASANTLAKTAYAVILGSRRFGLVVAGGSLGAVAAGSVAYWMAG